MSSATVVLVHGATAGSWTWHLVVDGLTARGIDARAVDLPSCSAEGSTVDVHDDARHVRSLLDEISGPIVLVGNSYGGAVISESALDHPGVTRLVYIAALMPRPNERFFDMLSSLSSGLVDGTHLLEDGRLVFDADIDLDASFQQASDDERDFIRPYLGRPMSMGSDPGVCLTRAAWKGSPSTYVVCLDDQALPVSAQREWAKQATDAVEWPSDHSPQHSHPDLVVDLLERLATA